MSLLPRHRPLEPEHRLRAALLLSLLTAPACSGGSEEASLSCPAGDPNWAASPLPPCPGARPALEPLCKPPTYALLRSDYTSSSLTLLDAEGRALAEGWVDSGSRAPGLVTALSNDVELPTRQADGESLTYLDRFRSDVVSRFCLRDGSLLGQVRTHRSGEGRVGYSSNPQDVVFLSPAEAWVSRFEPNLDPQAAEIDRGNDLLRLAADEMSLPGERIDLSAFDAQGEALGQGERPKIYARPSRMLRFGRWIAVALARLSIDFRAAAEGRIALVDPQRGEVRAIELSGLKNCGRLTPSPEHAEVAFVACIGFALPWGDEAQIRATSGIVRLRFDPASDQVWVDRIWRSAEGVDRPLALQQLVALDSSRVVATAWGKLQGGPGDVLYRVDLESGEALPLYESSEAFALGLPAFDPEQRRLLLPDAAKGILRFELESEGLPQAPSLLELANPSGLAARQIYTLKSPL